MHCVTTSIPTHTAPAQPHVVQQSLPTWDGHAVAAYRVAERDIVVQQSLPTWDGLAVAAYRVAERDIVVQQSLPTWDGHPTSYALRHHLHRGAIGCEASSLPTSGHARSRDDQLRNGSDIERARSIRPSCMPVLVHCRQDEARASPFASSLESSPRLTPVSPPSHPRLTPISPLVSPRLTSRLAPRPARRANPPLAGQCVTPTHTGPHALCEAMHKRECAASDTRETGGADASPIAGCRDALHAMTQCIGSAEVDGLVVAAPRVSACTR